MRRGLISWSREEMPVAVLEGRVAQLQAAMRAENLDAVLAYTSFAQPAAVHWLSNFTPYWSEATLVVFREGAPLLLASLTKRVHQWIREVCHIGDVLMVPRLGAGTANLLNEKIGANARIGVIGLESLPWSVAQPLFSDSSGIGNGLIDASAMFASLRQPADASERKLAIKAAAIGRAALDAVPGNVRHASEVTAAIEASARLAGAEEVLQRIVPDLGSSATLLRMEGDVLLGAHHAIELSLAYKGAWVRLGRSVATTAATPHTWQAAERWFAESVARIDAIGNVGNGQLPMAPPGKLLQWTLEASCGVQPLTVVASNEMTKAHALPAGSLAIFSAQLALEDGHWYRAAPVIIGDAGSPGTVLGAR
jgi:hypothetical protein